MEFTRSRLASEKESMKNHSVSQVTNTTTMGIAAARCVRATIQPVAVCVCRSINKHTMDSRSTGFVYGGGNDNPRWRNFVHRKSQTPLTAQPVATARKASILCAKTVLQIAVQI